MISIFIIKSLVGLKKRVNPIRSVAKPGVRSKIPEITMNKPSPIALIKFFDSLILKNFKLFSVFIPSRLIKKPPRIAVKITNKIVLRDPINSPTTINKYISINGTEIKITKNKNIFFLNWEKTLYTNYSTFLK